MNEETTAIVSIEALVEIKPPPPPRSIHLGVAAAVAAFLSLSATFSVRNTQTKIGQIAL